MGRKHDSAVLQEALDALVCLTNNADPVCPFCGKDATAAGDKHASGCIISKLREHIVQTGSVSRVYAKWVQIYGESSSDNMTYHYPTIRAILADLAAAGASP